MSIQKYGSGNEQNARKDEQQQTQQLSSVVWVEVHQRKNITLKLCGKKR